MWTWDWPLTPSHPTPLNSLPTRDTSPKSSPSNAPHPTASPCCSREVFKECESTTAHIPTPGPRPITAACGQLAVTTTPSSFTTLRPTSSNTAPLTPRTRLSHGTEPETGAVEETAICLCNPLALVFMSVNAKWAWISISVWPFLLKYQSVQKLTLHHRLDHLPRCHQSRRNVPERHVVD
jgi:hypothetical protein